MRKTHTIFTLTFIVILTSCNFKKEKEEISEKMSGGDLPFDELQKLSNRIIEISNLLEEKEMRWLELSEIAFLLGYREASSFHRAFQHWEGRSPGHHRKSTLRLSRAARFRPGVAQELTGQALSDERGDQG